MPHKRTVPPTESTRKVRVLNEERQKPARDLEAISRAVRAINGQSHATAGHK